MLIKDLHHVNIHVDDLVAAEDFYVGVLGLTKLARPLESPGTWLAAEPDERERSFQSRFRTHGAGPTRSLASFMT